MIDNDIQVIMRGPIQIWNPLYFDIKLPYPVPSQTNVLHIPIYRQIYIPVGKVPSVHQILLILRKLSVQMFIIKKLWSLKLFYVNPYLETQ